MFANRAIAKLRCSIWATVIPVTLTPLATKPERAAFDQGVKHLLAADRQNASQIEFQNSGRGRVGYHL